MRFLLIAGALVTALISANSVADSLIKAGPGVKLLAHNGLEVSQQRLHTADGVQQVLVSYSVDLSRKVDQSDIQSGSTWVLRFDAKDSEITLQAPVISNRSQFQQFDRDGNWRVTDSDRSIIPFSKYLLKKEGFQFARDYGKELARFNRSGHAAALKTAPASGAEPASAVITEDTSVSAYKQPILKNPDISNANTAEQMLHYWYRNADQSTRNKFKAWLQGQP